MNIYLILFSSIIKATNNLGIAVTMQTLIKTRKSVRKSIFTVVLA